MKLLPPSIIKTIFFVALAFLGYELEPRLFPQEVVEQTTPENPKEKEEVAPEKEPVVAKKEAPAPLITQQEKPKPEVAEMKPQVKAEPIEQAKKASLLDTASLILVGNNASSKAQLDKDAELLEYASYNGQWAKYRKMIHSSLADEHLKVRLEKGSRRYEKLWDEPKLYTALLRWQALNKFPADTLSLTKTLSGAQAMMQWLMTNDSAMEELILTLHKNDEPEKVFKFLAKVWNNQQKVKLEEDTLNSKEGQENDKLVHKYFNLALACAVVFDQPVSYKNPTSEGDYVDGYFRYHWYRAKSEKGLLEGDIHTASAKDLTFVVSSPVSTHELEWALKKYRSESRKNFGQAYSDVEYLMERAVEGLDPYAEYTLPEILKEGGICGDQTYFSVNTARAAGIPAFGLSGITNSGGHAWAAVKTEDDQWSTKIGRIGGVSRGKGRDPQTGDNIIEQEVWLWSEREHASKNNIIKIYKNLWLADFYYSIEMTEEKDAATYLALNIGQSFPFLWKKVYQIMLTKEQLTANPALPETIAIWKKFVKEMKYEFRENPRMSALSEVIEDKHIFPHDDLSESRKELARLRRRNTNNAEEQADLQTDSLKRESELILKKDEANALIEVHQLYDRALREYAGSVTGFQEMMQFYFNTMKADKKMGPRAVRNIELAFGRVVDTGSDDWFRKKVEVAIHKKIAAMYREIGEVKRAENMEKRLERDMKNAERKAL